MEKKNIYANRSKIPEDKFKQMVRLFAEDFTAGQIAEISNINRNTVNRYLMAIRQRIASSCEEPVAAETARRSGVRATRGLHPLAISDGPEKGMPIVRVQAETGSFIRLRGCSGCDGLIRIGQDEL
jgi:transposase